MERRLILCGWCRLALHGMVALAAVLGLVGLPQTIAAAPELTATPLTWNVVGLDSSDVSVGPNTFPVGVRVCNTGTEAVRDVEATFAWDDGNVFDPIINLRSGSLSSYTLDTLAAGACHDFYYEVSITRTPAAYDQARRYHVDVTVENTLITSTPRPREIVVAPLNSQNRNGTIGLAIDGVPVPAGGGFAVVVGNTYDIRLDVYSTTNGYEQLETFVNFANAIFRINSVSTTFTADAGTDPLAPTKLYADGCLWDADPNSPNYLSCLATGKYGGRISVTYNVTIMGGGGTSQMLNTLIYDLSGSSFHYNADYYASGRIAAVIDPAALTLAKAFSPTTTTAGGISRLTFTVANPNAVAVGDVSFSDVLPTNPATMTIANPPDVTTSGCGTPSVSASAGSSAIDVTGITVGAGSTCAIGVNVTAPTTGTFTNTSGHLFVDNVDTGSFASATLTVSDEPPPPAPPIMCPLPVDVAVWSFENATASTSTQNGPFAASTLAAGVTSARGVYRPGETTPSASGIASTTVYPTGWLPPSVTGSSGNSWGIRGGWPESGTPTGSTFSAFEFQVSGAAAYGGYGLQASFNVRDNWSNIGRWYVLFSTDRFNWSQVASAVWPKDKDTWVIDGIQADTMSQASDTVYFRIIFVGAQISGGISRSTLYIDNVRITGCAAPADPTLTKSFSPDAVAVGGTSTLTFVLSNPNPLPLMGAAFSDALPAGVEVADPPQASTTCSGRPVWNPTAGDTMLSFSGGTIPADGSCTVHVNVIPTTAGPHPNVSSFISTAQTGTNSSASGLASATLTAILPPTIVKSFVPDTMMAGEAVTMTFVIENPNADVALTGVSFMDMFPTLPGVMAVASPPNPTMEGCGSPIFVPAGPSAISFSRGTIPAGGTCTVQLRVTAPLSGTYTNTTTAVTADVTGGTETGSAPLYVRGPQPGLAFAKQIALSADGPWHAFVATPADGAVYYRFVIENTGDTDLTGLTIVDPLVPAVDTCEWVDGNGDRLAAAAPKLPPADADEGHIATCVVGPVTAQSGSLVNTATVSSNETGQVSDSATYATTGLSLSKAAGEVSYTYAGDPLTYSYTITNTGYAPLQGPVTVVDDRTTVTCPAVSSVGDGDDFLDPGESIVCTATDTVTSDDLGAGKSVTNTAQASVEGVLSAEATATVPYMAPTAVGLVGVRGRAGVLLLPVVVAGAGVLLARLSRRRRALP